jgi:hypothetical protein
MLIAQQIRGKTEISMQTFVDPALAEKNWQGWGTLEYPNKNNKSQLRPFPPR